MYAGKALGLCKNPHCRRKASSGRHVCRRCRDRAYRKANPLQAVFNDRRKRARQRGIVWNLSFEEFAAFCLETNYLGLRGKTAGDMSIDRKDETLPYQAGNLQILTVSQNSRKMHAYRGHVVAQAPGEADF